MLFTAIVETFGRLNLDIAGDVTESSTNTRVAALHQIPLFTQKKKKKNWTSRNTNSLPLQSAVLLFSLKIRSKWRCVRFN